MASKTNRPDASTSQPQARSARSKAQVGDQPVSTASSGLIRRNGRLNLVQVGLGFAIAAMVVCALVLTLSLSIHTGLLNKFPYSREFQSSQAMEQTMPLVMIGYLSRENGGPVYLMQDRVVGCQYFQIPDGSIYPRLRADGTPFCEAPSRQLRQVE